MMKIYTVNKDINDYNEYIHNLLKCFLNKEKAEKYLKEQQEEFTLGRKEYIDEFGPFYLENGELSDTDKEEEDYTGWSAEKLKKHLELYHKYYIKFPDDSINFYIKELKVEE